MTYENSQVNGNKLDPLLKPRSDHGKDLFMLLSKDASGFSYDDVVAASMNLVLNAIRQSCSTSQAAEQAYDELMAKTKSVLLDQHYAAGKRKSVFPFHQVISPGLAKLKNRINQR